MSQQQFCEQVIQFSHFLFFSYFANLKGVGLRTNKCVVGRFTNIYNGKKYENRFL